MRSSSVGFLKAVEGSRTWGEELRETERREWSREEWRGLKDGRRRKMRGEGKAERGEKSHDHKGDVLFGRRSLQPFMQGSFVGTPQICIRGQGGLQPLWEAYVPSLSAPATGLGT